ncbi:TolC family outer membrane protein [Duganella levis]|uniref:TolC family outer membrane protein n=1 Tax=Duganella levis TaxID=2692169 RepID=A0ABW9WA72_9BURK|nr:TolC family outer membrane protein [Duganella levis]MYN30500.1 TolC family outer membrane protein [Duganella levis]
MATLKLRPRLLAGVALMGAALSLTSQGAQAVTLVQAYQMALQNDPTYRAAFYANEGSKENAKLGLSNLLPNLSGSWSGSQNRDTITDRSFASNGLTVPRDFISRSATLQLRQSLFNLDGWARYKQGKAQTKYGQALFESQQQEVIYRVVSAYLDVLYKQELLALSQVERELYAEQRKVNDRLFEKGEGTKTDMLETQARLDVADAVLLEAQDSLTVSRETLGTVIGGEVGEVQQLMPDFRVRPSDGQPFDYWKKVAIDTNPDIKTLQYGVEIAEQEVLKQYAGHAPRVDIVGTYGKTSSDSITTFQEDQKIRSIGFQVNIPLYSGGQVSASARQAVASREKAKQDLQAQIDKIVLELRKDYSVMASSVKRVDALMKSVASSETLIVATEQSIKGGVRINLDALNAKQQLYAAKRDLAQARFNYLLTSLRMHASVGTLGENDVREMAAYFR